MMKTEKHNKLTDEQILNVNREISGDAVLFYIEKIGLYAYAGDVVCYPPDKPSTGMAFDSIGIINQYSS